MKVYTCVQYDYEGSDVYRVFKSKKKAEYVVNQVNRLFNVYNRLFDLRQEVQQRYWNDNPQLIDSAKLLGAEEQPENKKINKLLDKVEDVLDEFGASSFYSVSMVEEKRLE